MAAVLTDERIAAVLRPFVRATAPVLDVLRESDPLRLRGRFEAVAAEAEQEGAAPDEATAGGRQDGERDVADGGVPEQAGEAAPERPEDREEQKDEPTRGEPEDGSAAERDLADADHPGQAAGTEGSAGDEGEKGEKLTRRLLRQLDGMRLPGSSTWDAMTVPERCDWWVQRVGRLVALVAGLPRFGGVVTSRLPIRNALGLAGQGLLLSAIAAEHGVTDPAVRVRLIAQVLLDRKIPEATAAKQAADEDAETAELTEELDAPRGSRLKAVVRTVWRMARALWEIDSELDKRPQGRFYHEWIGNVPVVGVVGGYLGERSALRRVSKRGVKWLQAHGYAGAAD